MGIEVRFPFFIGFSHGGSCFCNQSYLSEITGNITDNAGFMDEFPYYCILFYGIVL